MGEPFDSEWFMAVNGRNRFTVAQGVARTALDPRKLVADLFVDGGRRLHARVRADVDDAGKVIGTVTGAEPGEAPLPVRGYYFQAANEDEPLREDLDVAIVLTDGWTTIGLAKAARR